MADSPIPCKAYCPTCATPLLKAAIRFGCGQSVSCGGSFGDSYYNTIRRHYDCNEDDEESTPCEKITVFTGNLGGLGYVAADCSVEFGEGDFNCNTVETVEGDCTPEAIGCVEREEDAEYSDAYSAADLVDAAWAAAVPPDWPDFSIEQLESIRTLGAGLVAGHATISGCKFKRFDRRGNIYIRLVLTTARISDGGDATDTPVFITLPADSDDEEIYEFVRPPDDYAASFTSFKVAYDREPDDWDDIPEWSP